MRNGELVEVTFVGHYCDSSLGQGMSRYCYNILKEIEKQGVTAHSIYCNPKEHSRMKSGIDFFLKIPYNLLFSSKRIGIYHLTAPQAGFAVPIFKKLRKNKVVTTIYDLHPFFYASHTPIASIVGSAIKTASKSSDHLVSISSLVTEDIVTHFGIEREKITDTPIGVDPRFRAFPKNNDIFTIGYLGGFGKNKNVDLVLKAYSIFEKEQSGQSRLLIYGKGALLEECKHLAKDLKIKNIRFMGFAPEDKIVEIYNSFDLFVFPSQYEGFGLPILEAQKCGVPTIVLSGARIPKEVTKYCPYGKDEYEIAEQMKTIFNKGFRFSPEHLTHIKEFTWENCAEKTLLVYRKLSE